MAAPSAAFDERRADVENTGHLVFLFSIGKQSRRGYSVYYDLVFIIVVNIISTLGLAGRKIAGLSSQPR